MMLGTRSLRVPVFCTYVTEGLAWQLQNGEEVRRDIVGSETRASKPTCMDNQRSVELSLLQVGW